MKRKFRFEKLLAALATLTLGGGCGDSGGGAGTPGAAGPPEPGGTLVMAVQADMTVPLAIISESTLDANLGGDVMNMELVRGEWDAGRLVFRTADQHAMALARSYEYFGPDSASIRFHMRSDVKWSDGVPLTAKDVVYTYEMLGNPEVASPNQNYVDFLDAVEAENDSTVVFRFSHRYADMLSHTAMALLPEHIFGSTPPAQFRNHQRLQNPENGNLVVSGPYMIGSWQRGQQIVLVRNPEFQPQAFLDQVVIRIIPDPVTRTVELRNQGVDFLEAITLDQIPSIRQEAPFINIVKQEKRFYDYVAYNGGKFAPFNDVDIRRALGQALDVPGIIAALQMEEFALPAGGPYAPIFADIYDPQGQAPLPRDTAAARRTLESKGWRDSNGDGILDRNGQPFSFTLAIGVGNQRRADVAQIAQQQWRQLGIEVRIQQVESNTLFDNLLAGDFQAVLATWSVALYPDLTALWAPGSAFNFTKCNNPEVTRLINEALEKPTAEQATPLWREAASRIAQDQPYTWLYFLDAVGGMNNRVQGARIDTYGPLQNLWEWWIPADRRRPGESGAAGATGSS